MTVLGVLSQSDIYQETGNESVCVPGSIDRGTTEVVGGKIYPTREQAAKAFADIKSRNPDMTDEEIGTEVGSTLVKDKMKTVSHFSCTSTSALISSILIALLTSLVPAGLFLTARWILAGFRKGR